MKRRILSNKSAKPIGPYNQAILANDFLFISGQIPMDKDENLINSDIKQETIQVMNNIKSILQEANMKFSNLVKVSIFITDMGLFEQVNSVYANFFDKDDIFPARETIEVSKLPKGVNIEISAIATSSKQ